MGGLSAGLREGPTINASNVLTGWSLKDLFGGPFVFYSSPQCLVDACIADQLHVSPNLGSIYIYLS
jgi:hypothetical protein